MANAAPGQVASGRDVITIIEYTYNKLSDINCRSRRADPLKYSVKVFNKYVMIGKLSV